MQVSLVATTQPNFDFFESETGKYLAVAEAKGFKDSITAEQMIVYIARVSSPRDNKLADPEKLIDYLIRNKHWSPFEQADLTIKIVTSRAISAQVIRHWSMRFQEFSQRYSTVQNFEDIEFRMAGSSNRQGSTFTVMVYQDSIQSVFLTQEKEKLSNIQLDELFKLRKDLEDHMINTKRLYERLTNFGIAPECSRMILPMASQTTIFIKGNIRSWVHWIQARSYIGAQKEVREIAEQVETVFKEEFPVIYNAVKKHGEI